MNISTHTSSSMRRIALLATCVASLLALNACMIPAVVGGMGSVIEKSKKLDVPADYDGLEGKTVAVLASADHSVLMEHAAIAGNIAANVALRIAQNVDRVSVLGPGEVEEWKYRTPRWQTLAPGEIAKELGVERLVVIDLYEYRLNPLGNSWIWDGVAGANINVAEVDSISPDEYVFTKAVVVAFPDIEGLGRNQATATQVNTGLALKFVQRASWLFYRHIEDKYPK